VLSHIKWCINSNVSHRTSQDTYTHTHNRFTALWILSGTIQVSWYQKKHSPTHTYRGHQSSLICFLYLLRSTASYLFNYMFDNLFPLSVSKFSLVYLLAWHPPLYTPHIYLPNCLLFSRTELTSDIKCVVSLCKGNTCMAMTTIHTTDNCNTANNTHTIQAKAASVRLQWVRYHWGLQFWGTQSVGTRTFLCAMWNYNFLNPAEML